MKISFSLFLLFPVQIAIGQITYEPIFINQCSGEVEAQEIWWMSDSSQTFDKKEFNARNISLPKLGKYQLHLQAHDQPFEIYIRKRGLKKDTILLNRLSSGIFISDAAYIEYRDCDSLAQGEIIDYYGSGNIRSRGKFDKGKAIDSVFYFYQNGQLAELIIPKKDNPKSFTYYKSGQLKSMSDNKKHLYKEFYQSGQLQSESYRSWRYRYHKIEYYPNSKVKLRRNKKEARAYDSLGNLSEKLRRRESFYLGRFFGEPENQYYKYYKFKWESFDSKGNLTRKVAYSKYGLEAFSLPVNINQIWDYHFDKITFYENGRELYKMEFKYLKEGDTTELKFVVYHRINGKWIEESIHRGKEVYKLIEYYSGLESKVRSQVLVFRPNSPIPLELQNIEVNDSLEILWNKMVFEKGACIGGFQNYRKHAIKMPGLVFSEKEWANFSKRSEEKLTEFLILKLDDTTTTKIHTCPFSGASTGEMAVYCLQHIHQKNWVDFPEFKEYKNKETTGPADQAQVWLQNILNDDIQREILAELYWREIIK